MGADDALQDMFARKVLGFGAATRAGRGWGMFPESLAVDGPQRFHDGFVDVPQYWQCWKLDSAVVGRVADALRSAAAKLRS